MKPAKNTYGTYFTRYIDLAPEVDLMVALESSTQECRSFWSSITEKESTFRYAAGKWSLKELLQHVIDTERIFGYRALAIARGEQTNLPGYEVNEYANQSRADANSLKELLNDFFTVRNGTTSLFNNSPAEVLNRVGRVDGSPLSPLAAGFIIVGHEIHHRAMVKEKYLLR